MALEDLARLIAPRCPKNALKILRCFYLKDGGCTFAELLKATELKKRTLEYYLAHFRRWKILWTRREWMRPATYYLEFTAFHARLDTLLCDSLKNLVKDRMWEANERGGKYLAAEIRGAKP